jgi:hypothetical protein
MLNYDECRVNVFTQLYENGKPKGGVTYTFVVDSDTIMYFERHVVDCVKNVLADLSSEHSRVEYLSHEVEFLNPTDNTQRVRDAWEREQWERRLDEQDEQDRVDGELEFRGGQ